MKKYVSSDILWASVTVTFKRSFMLGEVALARIPLQNLMSIVCLQISLTVCWVFASATEQTSVVAKNIKRMRYIFIRFFFGLWDYESVVVWEWFRWYLLYLKIRHLNKLVKSQKIFYGCISLFLWVQIHSH